MIVFSYKIYSFRINPIRKITGIYESSETSSLSSFILILYHFRFSMSKTLSMWNFNIISSRDKKLSAKVTYSMWIHHTGIQRLKIYFLRRPKDGAHAIWILWKYKIHILIYCYPLVRRLLVFWDFSGYVPSLVTKNRRYFSHT